MTAPAILVIGRAGQVASALAELSQIGRHPVVCAGRPQVDLANPDTLLRALAKFKPCFVINAAAYTAVDAAEREREQAFAVNAQGAEHIAHLCADRDIPLVHLSTDYVFDGTAMRPYREDDPVAPLGAYGESKAAGEDAVRRCHPRHVIVRTSWVYAATGHNFLRTMLRLGAERDELSVVDDQRGAPTYAADIAGALSEIATQVLNAADFGAWGTYHLSSAGETTWYGFAKEIFRLLAEGGHPVPRLRPIATAEYPTPARRPAYSVLDGMKLRRTFGLRIPAWQDGVGRCLARLPKG